MNIKRRTFLASCAAGITTAAIPLWRAIAFEHKRSTPHPKPRPGITGAKILTAAQLSAKHEKLIPLFDGIRKMPQIIDGIRCNCGCGNPPTMYSLLSCYEGADAMAIECAICQGQGKLAIRLHAEGKALDDIRKALDAKFG